MSVNKNAELIKKERPRFALIDLFKLICVGFIVIEHVWSIFMNLDSAEGLPYPFFRFFEVNHTFYWNDAGVWIVIASFFLFGYHGKLNFWRIPAFIAAAIATQYNGGDGAPWNYISSYSWGLFSLLFVAYWLLLATDYLPARFKLGVRLLLISIIVVPHSNYDASLYFLPEGILRQALVGSKLWTGAYSGWFLLPWLGVLIASHEYGRFAKKYELQFSKFRPVIEIICLLGLVGAFWIFSFGNRGFGWGPYYNRMVFWAEPLELFAVMIVPFVIFRFALLRAIREKLAPNAIFRFISNLEWNRHLYLCYVMHLVFLVLILKNVPDETVKEPWFMQSLPLVVFVVTELVVRLLMYRWNQTLEKIAISAKKTA
ncbi:MAG: hypothetical protein V4736_12200 [Bdellovibrionota bacterium]